MSDEVVTHAEVLRWLPRSVAHSLEMDMPPDQRGWYTREEAERDGGRFVEVQKMSEREPKLWRVSD